jgi:hypothetical protein
VAAAPALRFRANTRISAADSKEAAPTRAQELGQGFDRAIALFQEALPGFGLKLVVAPPHENGQRGRLSVSAWRRSEDGARIHAAANASDALPALLRCKAEEDREMRARRDCPQCRGLGWTIATGGAKAVCAHPGMKDDL